MIRRLDAKTVVIIMTEGTYKNIIDIYLRGNINVHQFIAEFIEQWKKDRDNNTINDIRFQRLVNRIFTSCDCYSEKPDGEFEINEKQLKDEVELLRHIWFG